MTDQIPEILAELNNGIAHRRAAGDYPDGLELDLESEYQHVHAAASQMAAGLQDLTNTIRHLTTAAAQVSGVAPAFSRIPGGTVVHSLASRIVGRHTKPLAHQVRVLADETALALTEVGRQLENVLRLEQRDLVDPLAAVLDRLALLDQIVVSVRAIERRLDRADGGASPESK